jgi:hypothetical protein
MPRHTLHELHHDAADAKRDADQIGSEFTRKLREAFSPITNIDELLRLLAEMRDADCHAGYASGFVAGYADGREQ